MENQEKTVNVYAYKGNPNDILDSIRDGISRFGWSWYEHDNLLVDNDNLRKPHSFLRWITIDDWIVHINIPQWGYCIAAKVIKEYFFDGGVPVTYSDSGVDYRHCIGIDKNSLIEFNRNDPNIFPAISRRLKLQRRWWHIYDSDRFLESIKRIKLSTVHLEDGESVGHYHLVKEVTALVKKTNLLGKIAGIIQNTHPEKKLEGFVCDLFQRIAEVEDVKPNGAGWKSDYGADVIVKYTSGLPIEGIVETKTLVVQVKSYTHRTDDAIAVDQIKTALQQFNADAGLLISTAPASDKIVDMIGKLAEEMGKPIGILTGDDFSRFVLEHAPDLLSLN